MSSCIRLQSPSELVAVLPYQLGYHPERSVVVVAFQGSRLGVVQRLDLPPPADVASAADCLLVALSAEAADSVVLLGYEVEAGESDAVLDAAAQACSEAGIAVQDQIIVRQSRWFSRDCVERCCPKDGTPVPIPSDIPALAEFVGREIAPLPGRRDLEALVEVRDAERAQRIRRIAARLRESAGPPATARTRSAATAQASRVSCLAELLRTDDSTVPVPAMDDGSCAEIAVALGDVHLRDAVVAWLCPGSLPADLVDEALRAQLGAALPARQWSADIGSGPAAGAQGVALRRLERRLVDLCALLEGDLAAAPLTVLAAFAWWRGDGALSRVALGRALGINPGYRLAMLMEQMVDLAIRPGRSFPDVGW